MRAEVVEGNGVPEEKKDRVSKSFPGLSLRGRGGDEEPTKKTKKAQQLTPTATSMPRWRKSVAEGGVMKREGELKV